MKTKDYYLKELNSLRSDGAEFAKNNPGLSSFLAQEGQDPDVERILEGFAFLTGRLHQKFDEELPEVSHGLVQLLWPNYIRPIPAYSIIQFDPLKDDVKSKNIPKDTQVLSEKSSEDVVCKFRTSYAVDVMALDLVDVEYLTSGQKSSIELEFGMSTAGTLADVTFETLRLFLSGSKFMSRELYLYLNKYVEKIDLVVKDKNDKELESIALPLKSISGVGFSSSESMVPYPRNIFDGYMVLQEYFCFQEKYLFLDVLNTRLIEKFSVETLSQSNKFSLKISFNKRFKSTQVPTKEDFCLYCTPVINLFESDSIPIRKTEFEDEYLLTSSELKRNQSEVFSIFKVRGWVQSKNEYQDYAPFESFASVDNNKEYYSERVKLNNDLNCTDTYLRFSSSRGMFENLDHNNAVVSVKMLCTNKNIPSTLPLNGICIPDPSSYSLGFKNITIPSISYPPPIGGDFLWKVISNMSLNYLALDNVKTLVMILKTYDFFGESDFKQKKKTEVILSGLVSISNQHSEMIYEGLPIRGTQTEIDLDPSKFMCTGEAYLFCCVLNEFLALYSGVNSFHRLVVNMLGSETFTWAPKIGSKEII